jgi:type IV pilus assembly protein PilC
MLFNYSALDKNGQMQRGSIDAIAMEVAISSLQRRGLIISNIEPAVKKSWLNIPTFERVSGRDVVVLSRQIATLFESQVSALRVFRMLSAEAATPLLERTLGEVANDIQGGSTLTGALAKHPKVFSSFYVNMVRSGEESGKLDEIFSYLADYLDRFYEVTSKMRNALIYPAFVIVTFVVVMILMLTLIIPRISQILIESGQDVPFFTKVVIGLSNFFLNYGILLFFLSLVGAFFLYRYSKTPEGHYRLDELKLAIPYIGELYKKLYLSRFADNMNTMLGSGIAMLRALEITASVIGNAVYEKHIKEAIESVKGGKVLSAALQPYPEIPGMLIQMIVVGEESGKLGAILKTLARFYQREVNNAVDTLVNLIEPAMIVLLGAGVGILLAAVLMPIYNISSAI